MLVIPFGEDELGLTDTARFPVMEHGLIFPIDGQVIAVTHYDFQAGDTRPSKTVIEQQYAELVEMPHQRGASAVWIVDDDLGFVWWLGEIFVQAKCRAFPALSCAQALSLMRKLNVGVDLIVVNPHMQGVPAMLDTLHRTNGNFKIVSLQDPSEPHVSDLISTITLERPSRADRLSRSEWLKKIRRLLKQVEVVVPSRK
jgi:hypothetical protein